MHGVSYGFYKEEIKQYLESKFEKDATILDVGAGSGTYLELLKDYFKTIDGVEAFLPNIIDNQLKERYHRLFHNDIKDLEYDYYDIIIFGDIIEHLEIEEANKVLRYAFDRCKEMIVAVPYCYPQGIEYGNIYEIHKQDDLTKENMLERYPYLELLYGNDYYGYYIKKNPHHSIERDIS